MQRHGQPTAGAGPAAGDPTKVMDTNLSRGMDSARVCKAQSLRKLAPAGRPSGSTGTKIARPSGTDASHRRPNHRAKHVHHCARGRLRQGRGHRLGDGRSLGFGLRPGTLRASPAPSPGVVGFQSSLLDRAEDEVQGRSASLPKSTALNKGRRAGNGVGERGGGSVGRVVTKAVLLADAGRLRLKGGEVRLDPTQETPGGEEASRGPRFSPPTGQRDKCHRCSGQGRRSGTWRQ